MLCPFCSNESTKVLESRLANEKSSVRRRRECENCFKRFTTYERVENSPLIVIKKNKRKEVFSKEKILNSIKKSCLKTDLSKAEIEKIVNSIELEISLLGKKEVNTSFIGEQVLKSLKNANQIAYFRYLSVFKSYNSIDELLAEVKCSEKIHSIV